MTTSIKKDYFSPKFPRVQVCKTDFDSPDEEMPLLTLLTLPRRDLRLLGSIAHITFIFQVQPSASKSNPNVTAGADESIVVCRRTR